MSLNYLKYFIRGFISGTKEFGENITVIINSVLLTFVYFVGVGPTAIIARAVGKKFLDIKQDSEKETYWVDVTRKEKNMEEYYRQF